MPGLNLLPWREHQRRSAVRRLQGLLVGVVLMAAIVTWLTDHLGRQALQRQLVDIAAMLRDTEQLDAQLAQLEQHQREQEQIRHQHQALDHLQGTRFFLLELLERLERAMPQGVNLTAVTRQQEHLQVSGLADSSALVGQLLRNLSAQIGEAAIQQMKAVDEGEAFELSLALGVEP